MMRMILIYIVFILFSTTVFAELTEDNGCFFSGKITIISANAYFVPIHSDVSGFSFFPAKLFSGKTLPVFMNCYSFNIFPEETKSSHYPKFSQLSEKEKNDQGYNLVNQVCFSKDQDFVVHENAILVNRYMLYKPFLFYKRALGSCDIFFQFQNHCLSVFVKSNYPKKINCYWDAHDQSIVMKAK